MKNYNIAIQYIYHSGFLIETQKDQIIFDFYQGNIDLNHKQVTFFSSHVHADHYNPDIFEWRKERPNTQYVLSSDIRGNHSIPQNSNTIMYVSPHEEIVVNELKIQTYGSTDEGVSYLVESEGITLFHAGDLNWWHWHEDSPFEIEKAEKLFKEEIAKIKGKEINIAFFPVDPRLENYYSMGAEYFIQEIKPKILIPMHFGNNYDAIKEFAAKMNSSCTHILEITHRNQWLL